MSRFIIFQTNAEYYSAPWEIAKNNYSLDDYRAVYCEVIIDEIQYRKEITLTNQVGVALFISLLCILFGNEWLFYTRAQLYEDTVTCRSNRYIIELPEKKRTISKEDMPALKKEIEEWIGKVRY